MSNTFGDYNLTADNPIKADIAILIKKIIAKNLLFDTIYYYICTTNNY